MTDYKMPNDHFDAWWPNLCVISEAGCPVPVMVSAARQANEANGGWQMKMVTVKAAELEGKALDWAVAKAICPESFKNSVNPMSGIPYWSEGWLRSGSPSSNWEQLGPLIEEYEISIIVCDDRICRYWARGYSWDNGALGDTPKIAACRAIAVAKLGAEIEVPEELL